MHTNDPKINAVTNSDIITNSDETNLQTNDEENKNKVTNINLESGV